MIIRPDMSVLAYARYYAAARDYRFRLDPSVKSDQVVIDGDELAVSPEADTRTLRMNTEGPLLPPNR